MPQRPRIFISYARRDGGQLALRLKGDLEARGFDVWLDRDGIQVGDVWAKKVEEALGGAEFVLALLSEGSFASDTCGKEQGWALDAGKRVIPVRVQSDCRTPLRLSGVHYVDFSDSAKYDENFEQLLRSLGERGDTTVYNNAPALPDNFVDRPALLTRLRDALFEEAPQRNIALTALDGMGGIGKTVLAQALCHYAAVQRVFPDGIFWFTIGREARGFEQRIEAVPGLKRLLGAYSGDEACVSQYRHALREKAALIVLDDVWNAGDIEPFRTESPRSRVLITTRDAGIAPIFGARAFTAELLADAEARAVLATWAGVAVDALPAQATEVLHECKRLPLALAMIGAQLKGKPAGHWDIVLGHLRKADWARIKARFPEPHTSLFRAIEVSVESLRTEDAGAARQYLALAVLLEDMAVAPVVQRTLWNVDEAGALETCDRFVELSLAQREGEGDIRLHDLQLDYVRAQYPDREALDLIHGAVRLSAHVIEKDPRQFASQVVGRLLPHKDVPAIQQFIDKIAAGAPAPWLRPLQPALHPPGTPLLRTLEGHSASVFGVAMTTDGRLAISASGDHTLKVWDLNTGRALRTLEGHSAPVYGVAVTPDSRLAISASGDRTLKVWELNTGRALPTLEGHSADVNGVAVSPDGRLAISASGDHTLKVWDLETGRALHTLRGHFPCVYAVAVTPDSKRAVSGSGDDTLKVWDLDTGHELRSLAGHSGPVYGAAVTPDGKRVVSASWDNPLKVWDLDTGRELRVLTGHSDSVSGVAVTPDGSRAVSASWDKMLKIWDLETGRVLGTLEGHSDRVHGAAVAPDGKRAVSASRDKTLKVWNLETGRALGMLEGHPGSLDGVAVTPDGKRAVSASLDKTLKVWDLDSGRATRTLEGHSAYVTGVAVTPDGERAVSASLDHTLKVWRLETGRPLRTLVGHSSYVSGVAVTPDGKRVISASWDKTLKVWELDTGRELRTLEGHSHVVTGVAVTPDGKWAVSASSDKTLMAWDLETGGVLRILEGHSADVWSVAVTPDGERAVSASGDHTLKLWNLDTGQALRLLEGHSSYVSGVAVAADGRRAVSTSLDKTLKVWNLDSGLVIATFDCEGAARCCAFADDRRIVAGDEGGRLYILSLEE